MAKISGMNATQAKQPVPGIVPALHTPAPEATEAMIRYKLCSRDTVRPCIRSSFTHDDSADGNCQSRQCCIAKINRNLSFKTPWRIGCRSRDGDDFFRSLGPRTWNRTLNSVYLAFFAIPAVRHGNRPILPSNASTTKSPFKG
jgi:hypothetical protein